MTRLRIAFGLACLAGIAYSAATVDLLSALAYALAAVLIVPPSHHSHP